MALGLLALVVAGVAVVLAWRGSTSGLARSLTDDLRARAAARFPRPSHVATPLAGTFGALAAGSWDALAAREAGSSDVELCRAVREGEKPWTTLAEGCRREVRGGAEPLQALLEATHAAEAGPVAGLGTLDAPTPTWAPRGWSTLPYAAKLGALRVRELLAEGDAAGALRTCVDLEALARDTSWGAGLEGRLPAIAVQDVAQRPCAAALDAAPVEAKRSALAALAAVSGGMPGLDAVLAEYALTVRAKAFAPFLPDAATLPGRVPAWAEENAPRNPVDWRYRLALGDAWHRIDARLREVVAAARLPREQRVAALDALAAGERPRWNPKGAYALPQLGRVARTDARARSQLLLLRRALAADVARIDSGRWPAATEFPGELAPSAEHPLEVSPAGDALTLVDPSAPRGDLAVTVRADR